MSRIYQCTYLLKFLYLYISIIIQGKLVACISAFLCRRLERIVAIDSLILLDLLNDRLRRFLGRLLDSYEQWLGQNSPFPKYACS